MANSHQSTADQFFSESQFESYRRLGYHVLRSAFDGVDTPGPVTASVAAATPSTSPGALAARYPLVKMFQDLTRKWYAPIPVTTEAATRLALEYVALMWDLVKTEGLEQMAEEIVGGTPFKGTRPPKPTPAEVAAGMALMQLIQNVYTEFGLESAFNRANPRNSGWTNVFRKWRQSPILHGEIWPGIEKDYHPLFRRYFEKDLEKTFDDVPEHH